MAAKAIVLILGAGPRVGASVANKFNSMGYQVALASRRGTGSKTDSGFLSLKADFTKPESIPALFDQVKTEFDAYPTVVVYNAAALTPPPDENSVLSISAESLASDLTVNTISPYIAAQQAVSKWATLPKETKKVFIYTGNILNVAIMPMPMTLDLGMGKSASSYWIGSADSFAPQGTRFFYADERAADGKIKGMALDGDAHGEFYAQLATENENIPWHATFVKDKGYVKFST